MDPSAWATPAGLGVFLGGLGVLLAGVGIITWASRDVCEDKED